jgi:hypothetical protein
MLRKQQHAWAVRDTKDLRNNDVRIPKDAQVFINDVYAEAQMCSVIYGQQIGVFKMFDFSHFSP